LPEHVDTTRLGRVLAVGRSAVLAVLLLVLGGAAQAGSPGKWTRVTDANGRNIDEVSLARTNDGVLHVFWRARSGSVQAIKHASVSSAGAVGATGTAVSGFDNLSNPDVVVRPDGSLQLFVGALRSGTSGIQVTTAGPSATSWTSPSPASSNTTPDDPGAAIRKDGTPIFAWAAGTNMWAHVGTDPASADLSIGPSPQCCFYKPDVAVDEAGGAALVAFYSNVSKQPGIFVQQLEPTLGSRKLAPRALTGGNFLQPLNRAPIVARRGGGVYLAYCTGYPTCKHVVLWRVGSPTPIAVAAGTNIRNVNLARGPGGRLWVMWQDATAKRVYATRTNDAARKVGARVTTPFPTGTSSVWQVSGEGSPGALDLLVSATTPGSLATWHTRVLPGLSIRCSAKPAGKKTGGATCTVTDAGAAVSGALVKAGGKTVKTRSNGAASLVLAKGRYTVSASKSGYTPASTRVRVR
jgi:hypothetical protein